MDWLLSGCWYFNSNGNVQILFFHGKRRVFRKEKYRNYTWLAKGYVWSISKEFQSTSHQVFPSSTSYTPSTTSSFNIFCYWNIKAGWTVIGKSTLTLAPLKKGHIAGYYEGKGRREKACRALEERRFVHKNFISLVNVRLNHFSHTFPDTREIGPSLWQNLHFLDNFSFQTRRLRLNKKKTEIKGGCAVGLKFN